MANITISDEMNRELEHYAKLYGEAKEDYIKQALQEKLEELHDVYIAEKTLSESSPDDWISIEDLIAERDLENQA